MRRLIAAFAATAVLAAGCSSGNTGSSTTPTSAAPAPATSTPVNAGTVVIKNFSFSPATLTVAPGTKVTVSNQDSVAHTLTSTSSPRAFETGNISPGAVATFTAPTKAGTYTYICTIHPFMHGTLTVS